MTQQPEEAAVGGEAPSVELSPEDRLNAAFADPENHKEEEEELPVEGEDETPPEEAEDETAIEEEADDLPLIDAPVSWDAEAKAKFAELPRDVQEYVSKRETERERFVQQKSQEAARAKQEVEQEALRQLSAYEQRVSQHLQQYAQQIQPQRPSAALLAHNPAAYAEQMEVYEASIAQQQQLQHQAQQYAQQAQQREQMAEQAYLAEQHQIIVENFPEYADPTTGPKLQAELSAVARELGYPPELIAQARASDIIAMRTASEWKAKATKYDALMAKKMEKVREAKGKPPIAAKPGSVRAPGAARQAQYAQDREAMRRGDKDATARVLDSFFDNKR